MTSFIFGKERVRLLVATGLIGVISFVHYLVGVSASGLLHSILGHLYIVPILLGAYWYGIKGGVAVSIASSLFFSPHLFLHWSDPFLDIYNFVEIFLFLLLGGVTGVLSEMERNQRQRYKDAIVRLDESHRKLREQTETLFKAEEQLRIAERLSALGELSASMAHEIRNPLGSIKGAAEILRDAFSKDDARFEFVQILLKETDRLNHILQDFLDFARSKTPRFQESDINEVMEFVLALTAREAEKVGVKVEKKLSPNVARINMDPDLMKQAFLNLVLNAIQAMPTGGVLTIECAAESGAAVVKVSDTGVGISAESRKRLFTPFFTTKKNGTGLGLAIVYRIIQNHNGMIDVESELGKGTTFIIRIPDEKTAHSSH